MRHRRQSLLFHVYKHTQCVLLDQLLAGIVQDGAACIPCLLQDGPLLSKPDNPSSAVYDSDGQLGASQAAAIKKLHKEQQMVGLDPPRGINPLANAIDVRSASISAPSILGRQVGGLLVGVLFVRSDKSNVVLHANTSHGVQAIHSSIIQLEQSCSAAAILCRCPASS